MNSDKGDFFPAAGIGKAELETLVPHKGKMFLLNRVTACDTEKAALSSEVDISESDLFFDPALGGVPVWVGFEYMAQSISALSGISAKKLDGCEPKIGFVMGVRDFKTELGCYQSGQSYRIQIKQIFRDNQVVSFDCSISKKEDQTPLVEAVVNGIEFDEGELQKLGMFP